MGTELHYKESLFWCKLKPPCRPRVNSNHLNIIRMLM